MANLTLRVVEDRPLTNAEVDGNFTNLNTEKLERDGSIAMTGDLTTTGVKASASTGLAVKNSAGTSLLLVGSSTTNILTQNNAKIGIGKTPDAAYNLHSNSKIAADVGVYAPIFYDIDNEGFYVDPDDTSNLQGLTVTDTITGSITGSAGSAAVLTTARTINGTSFNGSANITTSNWGTARTINGTSVNGSTNYVLEPYVEDDEDTNADRYIVFVDNSTAGYKRLNEDSSFKYNPSTNTLTSNVTGSVTGNVTGNLTGNVTGSVTGNASSASKWQTARTLSLTGDVTGSVSIDGSGNVSLTATVADDSHSHSNYLPLSGGTLTGNLTVGSGQINSYIYMADSNDGQRALHCNDNRIGFLADNLGWGSWCDDDGNWSSIGNVVAYFSDERLKTKTGKIEGAIDKVKSLEAFYYKANDVAKQYGFKKTGQEVGLSAQQVQAILPEIVELAPFDRQEVKNEDGTTAAESKSGENYLTLQYERLVPLLVEAIKEQQKQIEELKRIVETK